MAKKRGRAVAVPVADAKANGSKPLFENQEDLLAAPPDTEEQEKGEQGGEQEEGEGDDEESSEYEDDEAGLSSSDGDSGTFDEGDDEADEDEDDADANIRKGEQIAREIREKNSRLDLGVSDKDAPKDTDTQFIEYCDEGDNLAEESDSTDDEGQKNRVGNVPLWWYDGMEHIGYDVTGKKIVKKPKEDGLDAWIARQDDPNFGRTVYDKLNDEKIVLTDQEMSMINRIRHGTYAHKEFNEQDEQYFYDFSSQQRVGIIGNAIEPKRRFIPSKHEAKMVVKLVHAIRNGWLKDPADEDKEDDNPLVNMSYLMWKEDEKVEGRSSMPPPIPAPRMALPGHAESYNPPPEYLPTPDEIDQWNTMDPDERPRNYLPKAHDALRKVPGYSDLIKERFERCLDLYLCPRVTRKRLNIDPESLVPELPKPKDLKPFPTSVAIEYKGHKGKIRSFSMDPRGQWLASGSDDGTVKIWEIDTGRCFKTWHFGDVIEVVAWNPNPVIPLLAVATSSLVYLIETETGSVDEKEALDIMLGEAKATAAAAVRAATETRVAEDADDSGTAKKKKGSLKEQKQKGKTLRTVDWDVIAAEPEDEEATFPEKLPEEEEVDVEEEEPDSDSEAPEKVSPAATFTGYRVRLKIARRVVSLVWHRLGDYFATATKQSSAASVLIHRLSRSLSTSPFVKSKGMVEKVMFHPNKPFFFVASRSTVRAYNLPTQKLIKKLRSPCKWISSIDIHPSGDHVIIGSYDRRVCWYDMDLGDTPYKTLKYHDKAVRGVSFHPTFPLFATSSDDGNVHIFHGMVYNDLLTNPLLVPVKKLKVQAPTKQGLGVMACQFHPLQPWLVTSGSDHILRLYT